MGKRGPAKTPTALAELRGNPGKRPLNEAEPQGAPASSACPEGLGEFGEALWNSVAPYLAANGLLSCEGAPLLEQACRHYERARQAGRQLAEQDMVVITAQGSLQVNPLVRIEQQSTQMVLRILQNYGCTPSSRTGLTAAPPPKHAADSGKKRLFTK